MSDIVEFLRAQLDGDEAVALLAAIYADYLDYDPAWRE